MLRNLISGPGWPKESKGDSAHYRVRSNLPKGCQEYAKQLEALRPHYEEVLGLKAPEDSKKPADVLIFDTSEGYYSYVSFTAGNRMENTLGVFQPWYEQLMLFEDPDKEESLRTLYHEGFHQYLHEVIPDAPVWFNEGMAEYVSGCRVEKGKVIDASGMQNGRLRNLQAALHDGWQPHPFEQVMKGCTSDDFRGDLGPYAYAQAWSMIHFMMQGADGKYRPMLRKYIDQLHNGAPSSDACEAAFPADQISMLEKAWNEYVRSLVPDPPRK